MNSTGPKFMKAILCPNYGSPGVLRYEEIERPTPGDDEILVKVRAASVNPLDWRFMRGRPYFIRAMNGLRKPKIARMGVDVAGEVEAVGRNVTQFQPGDEVFGSVGLSRGAFAEYVCADEKALVAKPANLTFEQAAAVPVAALTALQGLRNEGQIQAGQKVLINGAAGGVGTFAVQIAKIFGAEVTGVCSTRNFNMVRSIGADHVIDYTREDFTLSDKQYDLIFDCIANHSLSACRRVMSRNGTYVVVGGPDGGWIGPLAPFLKVLIVSPFVSQKLTGSMSKQSNEDLVELNELLETEKITPVIDRNYSLSEVPEAIRYLEEGHARGKVTITVKHDV